MLEPGQQIDRYTVDRLLGQGGMAVVYRVKHSQLGSFHALKVLTLTSAGIRERLLQEGRVQASLRHPNIVTVTDVIDVGGSPGLVMEYIEGPGLDEWLASHRPTMQEAESLFRSVIEGVAAAHDKGLVHRDLKPGNIMLAQGSGGGFIPKVADFGLAKALEAADPEMQKTRSGVTMGTPAYMAPEQIRDAKNVDSRADVFSLGCILYELICGRPPFAGPDILSIFNAVASGSYPPPISLIPDLPARVQNAIQGCLVVDREHRIPDCHVLLAVLDGKPLGFVGHDTGSTIAPAGPTWAGTMAESGGVVSAPASAPSGVPRSAPGTPSAGEALQEVPGEAPRAEVLAERPSEPPLDGSISPASLPEDTLSMPPRRRRHLWVLPALVIPAVLAVLALLVVAGGSYLIAVRWDRQARQTLLTRTGGEVAYVNARVRPRRIRLEQVSVQGADGEPVAEAAALELRGRWELHGVRPRFHAREVDVDGLRISARRTPDGWVVPKRTWAFLQGRSGASAVAWSVPVVVSGPVEVSLHAPSGMLTAHAEHVRLDDFALDSADERLWSAVSADLHGVEVRGGEPVLGARAVRLEPDGLLVVEDLDAWIRLRPDGLLDVPPVLAEAVPDWAGGVDRAATDVPWFGLRWGLLPPMVDRLEVSSGVVHLLDRSHAVKTTEWDVEIERIAVGPVGEGWLPLDLNGRMGPARLAFTGEARRDGLVRGRASVRQLPLERFAPYMERSLRHYGVQPAGGILSSEVELTMKADSVAAEMRAEAERVSFARVPRPPGAPEPPVSARRLFEPRAKVESSTRQTGSLADPAFHPVDQMVHAVTQSLMAPAGGAIEPGRAPSVSPGRPVRHPPVVVKRDAENGPSEPEATTSPEPESEASPEKPSRGEETPPTGDETGPAREIDRFGREVREALEELKLPPVRPKKRGE